MPVFLTLDIAGLALSLAFSTALLLIVVGAGLRTRANRHFVLFTLMETGWAAMSLLLRVELWFHAGNPQTVLELACMFLALMGPSLLLFAASYVRLRASWLTWAAIAIALILVAQVVPLFEGRLVSDPLMSGAGLVSYRLSAWGIVGSTIPALCFLAALVLFRRERRQLAEPFIAASVVLLLAGYITGGILQVRVPVMSLTNTLSVGVMGWGIVRRQLFNPLRDLAADLRGRASRQELIAQIGRKTTTLLDLDELLMQASTLIQSAFQYFTVGILMVEGDELVLRASTLPAVQVLSRKFRLRIGSEGICGRVAATGLPIIAGDVQNDPRYVQLVSEVTTQSELAVPIHRGGMVIGVLDVQSAQRDAFSHEDLVTQQTIADQLSSAIENARLYEETRRRADRLTLVNRISAAAGAVLDLSDLLETVHREVTPIFKAEAFFVALYHERDNELDFRIQVDEGIRERPLRKPLGFGLASRVIKEKRPLLVNDLAQNGTEDDRLESWGTGKTPSSWLGVPMIVGERIVGVMSVQAYGARRYDEEDLLLAATIADQVAVAVENARLYEEVRLELAVRERTEKILRESEEKFRNLAEQTPNMIFIHGQGKVVYANRQCEIMMGYTREEFYAPDFDFMDLTAPGFETIVQQNFQRHARGEDVPPYEYAVLTRAGRRIDAIVTTKLIRYDGSPAILGIITDISTRKRTERLLQSLNTVALHMAQALTPAEIFPAASRVLAGLGFDNVIFLVDGEPSSHLLHPYCWGSGARGDVRLAEGTVGTSAFPFDQNPAVAEALDTRRTVFSNMDPLMIVATHEEYGVEQWAPQPAAPGNLIISPLAVGDDVFGLLLVSGVDVGPDDVQIFTTVAHLAAAAWRKTRLMQDLESSLLQLRQTQEQLLHAQKMEAIGRLAGGIAHDFNNMLTVISGYTSLLVDALEDNANARADLDQIKTTIKRASALTSRLLAFSRKQILQPAVLDLNKVVTNSATLLRPLIGEDIELIVHLGPGPLAVRADHYQLEQVLMNLAVNARDAMPGGGTLHLQTACAEVKRDGVVTFPGTEPGLSARLPAELSAGQWVVLTVHDTGVGMSEETRAHLFEPFFTTKEEGKGSGLGLSTVYGIVSQSSGSVRVDSALGRGTTFTVCFPRVAGSGDAPGEERQPVSTGGSGTVLLVEDEPDVRELARRILEKGGYQVIPVSSAREALLVAEGSAVLDMVVTDVVMPGGMSGVEMGERLSRTRPALPVLYVSGYTDDVRFHGGMRDAKLPFLGKPFAPADLLSRVKEMIVRH